MHFASTLIVAIASAQFRIVAPSPTVKVNNATAPNHDSAPFAINIGEDSQDTVAWVGGQSKCNFVVLGPVSPLSLTNLSHSRLTSVLVLRSEPTRAAELLIS